MTDIHDELHIHTDAHVSEWQRLRDEIRALRLEFNADMELRAWEGTTADDQQGVDPNAESQGDEAATAVNVVAAQPRDHDRAAAADRSRTVPSDLPRLPRGRAPLVKHPKKESRMTIVVIIVVLAVAAYAGYRLLVARVKRDIGQSGD